MPSRLIKVGLEFLFNCYFFLMGLLEIVSGENNVRGISGTVIFVINTLSKSVLNAVSHILPLKKNNDLLFGTVCSSEHKVCSDEKSSTYMTGAALH